MQDSTVTVLVEKVENAIIALGKGIGQSADYVYPIVVKQKIIEGVVPLVVFILSGIICYISARKVKDWDEFNINIFTTMMLGIISFFSFILVWFTITQIFNPEYYALRDIIRLIKY